jgi:hypothetical protein
VNADIKSAGSPKSIAARLQSPAVWAIRTVSTVCPLSVRGLVQEGTSGEDSVLLYAFPEWRMAAGSAAQRDV